MTNFQLDNNRPIAAWLTPERAVILVPILAGLALATTLVAVAGNPRHQAEGRHAAHQGGGAAEGSPGTRQAGQR